MAWHMTGQLIEACSCKSACPCTLGPAEPDQGWCSGALTFAIQQGESDGVGLADGLALAALRGERGDELGDVGRRDPVDGPIAERGEEGVHG